MQKYSKILELDMNALEDIEEEIIQLLVKMWDEPLVKATFDANIDSFSDTSS